MIAAILIILGAMKVGALTYCKSSLSKLDPFGIKWTDRKKRPEPNVGVLYFRTFWQEKVR
jgi:hypothetical protein